ncbi:hypothetical protein AB0910_13425 [Streptomyces sp. NPDC047002]|uniref:hypothetical protein n=1 Tax=Streptomyces sp. NPDC047002 TaxID=3155475 RepID=UPI0034561514
MARQDRAPRPVPPATSGDPAAPVRSAPTGADAPGSPAVAAHAAPRGAGASASGPRAAEAAEARPAALAVSADGAYGARLVAARPGGSAGAAPERLFEGAGAAPVWFPERWTLTGPEPYAVPLPLGQPEEPDSQVQPLADGRVLICRRVAARWAFSLLYPTGPGTGEVPLGAVECPHLTLLPPAPGGNLVHALAPGPDGTALWRVGASGPELVARVPGRCSGGAWLDRTGRLLALDRETGGVVKTVTVDLERGGELSPLLEIAEESDDRLLFADPDSGLLLIRSNAPGHDRIGWGVLGSTRPVRFPECLRPAGRVLTPFATQPGQVLTPESCAVAFRVDGPGGACVGLWRPADRALHLVAPPPGWLTGAGLWTADGVLRLPYATPAAPCAVAEVRAPAEEPGAGAGTGHPAEDPGSGTAGTGVRADARSGGPASAGTGAGRQPSPRGETRGVRGTTPLYRPVPLQQAPLQQAPLRRGGQKDR